MEGMIMVLCSTITKFLDDYDTSIFVLIICTSPSSRGECNK
jgi:hypothetical protein